MKKLITVAIVVVFGLFMLSSCDLTEQEIAKLEAEYGYTEDQAKAMDINKPEIGDDDDDQQEGDNY